MAKKYTVDELNSCSKETLITLFLSMQDQMEQLNKNMERLIEQVACANQQRFGRSSEKLTIIEGQLNLFNEMEHTIDTLYVLEPGLESVCKTQKKTPKKKGKREADLKGLPVQVIAHTLSEEKLKELFGPSWKQLPEEIYKRLRYCPAVYEVEEHHVSVYAGMDNQTIVKADRPTELLRNSIVTPSLEAAIMNGKYVNALPLYRMEQEFKRNGINLSRQVMANWTIKCSERYLSFLYEYLHEKLLTYPVLQADETPVLVTKDGRTAGSKSYMWVYRTGKMYEQAIVLYDYQRTRKTDHPRAFLKGFAGVAVTDGYQVYHKLEEEEDLTIAGCWSHARRRYADALKGMTDKESANSSVAYQALCQIATIYKLENGLSTLEPYERQKQRQRSIKPLVEAYFTWVKAQVPGFAKSKTLSGLEYSIHQEKYLKVFLENGEVPMDNNAAEQSIRGFCIGRNNWHLIDSINGAKASAVIYSIAETAKANNLKPYDYFEHLLTEIPKHYGAKDLSYLETLLPWSAKLPAKIRKTLK